MDLGNFEEQLMREYRDLAVQLSEARTLIGLLDPRFQKIAELIKAYGLEERLERQEPGDDPKSNLLMSKGGAIAQAASDLLGANGNSWIKLSDLYSHLVAIGVYVGGKNPSSTLSAHLSNSKMFEGDRAKGWRLRPKFAEPVDSKTES